MYRRANGLCAPPFMVRYLTTNGYSLSRLHTSGFLRVPRAPAFGVDRLAGEQLARTVRGGASLEEIAVRAGRTGGIGRRLRLVDLARILGVVQRLCGRIIDRHVRQISRAREARQRTGQRAGADRSGYAEETTT